MTALLELRENLKKIYSRNEAFITPVIKFLLSFIVLSIINGKMGYMTKLDNMAIVLIVSLLCSFLPTGFIVLFAMMFSLLHMYALSLETAAVGLVVFLLLYLLFLRFTAKEAMVVVLRIGKLRRCGILSASDSDHQCTYDQFHGCGRGYGEAASADRRHFGKQGYAGNHRGIYHYGGRSISHSQNECGSFLDHRNDRRSHDRSTDPAGGGSYV